MNFSELNTCYPAKIVTFDPASQTATVKLCIEKYFDTIVQMGVKSEANDLLQVPVHFPQCGTYSLTFPIQSGDDCLVFFAQRGIDHWKFENKVEAGKSYDGRPSAQHNRLFSDVDALAIVGFNPLPDVIPNFNQDNVELRNTARTQYVSLQPNGNMEVKTPATLTVIAKDVVVNATTATVNAETTINGDTTINGTLTVAKRASFAMGFGTGAGGGKSSVSGGLEIDGLEFNKHVHTSNGPGNKTTTPQ